MVHHVSHVLATHFLLVLFLAPKKNWQNTKGLRCRWSSHACWKLETLEVAPRGFTVSDARSLPMEAPRHLRDFTAITEGHWVEISKGGWYPETVWHRSVGFKEKSSASHPSFGCPAPLFFNLWMVCLIALAAGIFIPSLKLSQIPAHFAEQCFAGWFRLGTHFALRDAQKCITNN